MGVVWSSVRSELESIKQKGLFRERLVLGSAQAPRVRVQNQELINFCSNDYLALANDPRLVRSLQQAATKYGVGSGASPLVCGRSEVHQSLELALAQFTGRDRALLFSSGYLANLAVVTTFAGSRHAAIFQDKLNHASMLDAALLSRARFQRYPHSDLNSLDRLLNKSNQERKLVLTDSVFSMDGDQAPLASIAYLAKKYGALLVVDDAHGFGIFGEQGAGVLSALGLNQEQVPLMMATLGKSVGCSGAFVAGDADLIELLIQKARPYIYSTAMPTAIAAAAQTALQLVAEKQRRQRLLDLIQYFRKQAYNRGIPLMPSHSAIQPLLAGTATEAVALSRALQERGFLVTAIRPPTVPAGSSRLRITLSAGHSEKEIDGLLACLGLLLAGRESAKQAYV